MIHPTPTRLQLALLAGLAFAGFAVAAAAAPGAVPTGTVPTAPLSPAAPAAPPKAAPAPPSPPPPATSAATESATTIAFGELQRGQKGYGFSVFAGSEPERFEVEVIGVQRSNEIAGLDYLITRLSGHGLEKTGVAGGMSGSPVYFDGKLAGAVAFTFNFATEPIAGITPIDSMRAIPATRVAAARSAAAGLPSPPARTSGLPRVKLADLFDDKVDRAVFDRTLDLLAPGAGAGGRPALAFTASGFGPEMSRLLESRLGPLSPSLTAPGLGSTARPSSAVAGGSATPAAGGKAGLDPGAGLQPGDSVALVMVRGDLGIAAVGTVTDRADDQVLAFGHKLFGGVGGLGPLRFPMAKADVVTVMPGLQESFKIANVGELVGSFLEDRGTGSRGVLGPVWPMTPMAVKVHPADGGAAREFHTEVASDQLFRGFMMLLSTIGAVSAAGHDQGGQSVDIDATFHLIGHGDVRFSNSFVGGQAVIDSALQLMEYATWFSFNEFEPVDIATVEVEVRLHEEELLTRVIGAWPDHRKVRPGEKLGFFVELEDYKGERRRERFEYRIPADASGRFYLMIGDGRSADAAYAQVEKAQPENLEQGLELLRKRRSTRRLYVLGLDGGQGLSVGGRALPDLPGSQRALLAGAADAALPWRFVGEQSIELDRAAAGMVRIDLEVDRRAGLGGQAP